MVLTFIHLSKTLFVFCFLFLFAWSDTCSDIPPGLDWISYGVDITSLDIASVGSERFDNGFRRPLFKFSCDEEKSWKYNGNLYQLPDQVQIITVDSTGYKVDKHLFTSKKQMQDLRTVQVGLGIYVPGMFSAGTDYKNALKEVADQRNITIITSVTKTTLQSMLINNVELSSRVKAKVYNLSSNTIENYERYEKFFMEYGTHYWAVAKFGGYLQTKYTAQREFLNSFSETDLTLQAEFLFSRKFHLNLLPYFENNPRFSHAEETFLSTNETSYKGGEFDLLNDCDISEWEKTVPLKPAVVGGSLQPIYELIYDDEQKKKDFKQAYKIYLIKNDLKDLREILECFSKFYKKNKKDLSIIDKLTKQLHVEDNREPPNWKNLKSTQDLVKFHTSIPEWWQKVEFCLNIASETAENSKDCPQNKEKKFPICGFTNSFTDAYHDQMMEDPCNLDLGVMAPYQIHEWSDNIELCYKIIGCCPQNSTEKCVPLNQYLQLNLSHLSNRDDNCRVSWKIKAPEDEEVPEWFKISQFCFRFYRKDRLTEATKICAYVNSWTKDYGNQLIGKDCCQIQFGLFDTPCSDEKLGSQVDVLRT